MVNQIKLSVRELVEFVLRAGDIDATYMGQKRALEGTKVHTKLQNMRKKEALLHNHVYESEYRLQRTVPYKEMVFSIEGRADGLWMTDEKICIEEIKSTHRPLETIELNKQHWHLGQVKCYAYLFCKENDLPHIFVQITYYNIEVEDFVAFEEFFTLEELELFFMDLLERYYVFAKLDVQSKQERDASIVELEFPYPNYRKSQRALAVAVYKTIQQQKKLFAAAPTGTGKTISTLFPSIKAMERLGIEKIFYLTAKTITRKVAEEAVDFMTQKGLHLRTITLTAKERICFLDKPSCNPRDCAVAKGHFDRVNAALLDILENETLFFRNTIEAYAKKHDVCPFEFALDLSNFSHCIICDYNYVYDPKVYLKRYFTEGTKNPFVILNDEVHNLVDRSREMYSAQLTLNSFILARKKISKIHRKLYNATQKIIRYLEGWRDIRMEDTMVAVTEKKEEEVLYLLYQFTSMADIWLQENKEHPGAEVVLDLYFNIIDFLRISDYFDQRYVVYAEKTANDFSIKLLCLDTSYVLQQCYKKVQSSILFSATLYPMDYYKDVLGGNAEDYHLLLESPFAQENFCLLIDPSISTKYVHREQSYPQIAQRIQQWIQQKKGNYMVFFSSYHYMEMVFQVFQQIETTATLMIQQKNLTEEERVAFLAQFDVERTETFVAFTVLGGLFSEGIDLVGERLIGVCIVGVGLPLITKERDLLADYFKVQRGHGFDYAYKFPGMNKVLQAAGRVIRTEQDRGVVLLIDSRFSQREYQQLFPPEWTHFQLLRGEHSMTRLLGDFWGNSVQT